MDKPARLLRPTAILAAALFSATGCNENPAPKITEAGAPPAVLTPAAGVPAPGVAVTLPAAAKSAAPNSFAEVTAHLDAGGDLYLYLSTERWLTGLADQLSPLRDALAPTMGQSPSDQAEFARLFELLLGGIRQSGLEDISGVGLSQLTVAPGLHRQKFFLHHYQGKGGGFLWSLLGPAPHQLDALGLLPANTAFAAFQDIDLAQLNNLIQRAVGQAENPQASQMYAQAMTSLSAFAGIPAEDALKSFVGPAGLILTLDPQQQVQIQGSGTATSIARPGVALVLPAKDERVFQQLEKMVLANPGATKADEGELHLRSMAEIPITSGITINLKPALAKWGQYLIIASDEKLIRELVAAHQSGKGFVSTPEYAELSAGLPQEGNGFQVGTALFSTTIARVQQDVMKTQPGMDAKQQALMQRVMGQVAGNAGYSVSAHLPTGWFSAGNAKEAKPGGNRLGTIISAMAASAGPAAAKASEQTTATKSLSNVRQIVVACRAYAGDHQGKFPATLQELVPKYVPDAVTLRSPYAPDVAEGYHYTSGLTADRPATTVLLEDAHAVAKGAKRVVGYVDGSARLLN